MTIDTVSSSSAAASSSTGTSATSTTTETSDRFLKLLVAQMQNQDPLNPMDNAQVTSQMAQINTVSGIEKLNTSIGSLSTQMVGMQALQGASLVGHDVLVAGNKLAVTDGKASGTFELASAADAVSVDILNSAGGVIATQQLGAQSAGRNTFEWPVGSTDTSQGLSYRVTATSGATALSTTSLMTDKVTAISTSGDTLKLELQKSGSVAYSAVKAFN